MKNLELLFVALMIMSLTFSCKSQQEATNTGSTSASERSSSERQKKGPRSVDDIFKMDTNGDGKLAKTEIKGRLLKDFDKIDLDKDGFITKEELKNAPKPERGQRPQRGN